MNEQVRQAIPLQVLPPRSTSAKAGRNLLLILLGVCLGVAGTGLSPLPEIFQTLQFSPKQLAQPRERYSSE
jgi:hypothetical protein